MTSLEAQEKQFSRSPPESFSPLPLIIYPTGKTRLHRRHQGCEDMLERLWRIVIKLNLHLRLKQQLTFT